MDEPPLESKKASDAIDIRSKSSISRMSFNIPESLVDECSEVGFFYASHQLSESGREAPYLVEFILCSSFIETGADVFLSLVGLVVLRD